MIDRKESGISLTWKGVTITSPISHKLAQDIAVMVVKEKAK